LVIMTATLTHTRFEVYQVQVHHSTIAAAYDCSCMLINKICPHYSASQVADISTCMCIPIVGSEKKWKFARHNFWNGNTRGATYKRTPDVKNIPQSF